MRQLYKRPGYSDYHVRIRVAPYKQRRARLCTDRDTSRTWHELLQAAVDRKQGGEPARAEVLAMLPRRLLVQFQLVPSALSRRRRGTFADNVRDYKAELETAGRDGVYVRSLTACLAAVGAACGWRRVADVDRDGLLKYLAERKATGAAPRTLKNVRAIVAGFVAWAVQARRLDGDTLGKLPSIDTSAGRKRQRRALTPDEVARLLGGAGPRELVYRVALGSGLRLGELRRLQWRDVHVDTTRPRLELRTEATKSKRADTLPLAPALAARLRAARPADHAPTDPVFNGLPSWNTWLADCGRARIQTHEPADADGKRGVLAVGFHSLRVTFVSELQRAGVNPRTLMELARHTDYRLTAGTYTDRAVLDTTAAVARLPDYATGPTTDAAAARREGTTDQPIGVSGPNCPACVTIRAEKARPAVRLGASASADGADGGCAESPGKHRDSGRKAREEQTAPRRIRTYNLRLRRPMLYPVELAALRVKAARRHPTSPMSTSPAGRQVGWPRGHARNWIRTSTRLTLTRPSTWRVCQFRHPGVGGAGAFTTLTHISLRRVAAPVNAIERHVALGPPRSNRYSDRHGEETRAPRRPGSCRRAGARRVSARRGASNGSAGRAAAGHQDGGRAGRRA